MSEKLTLKKARKAVGFGGARERNALRWALDEIERQAVEIQALKGAATGTPSWTRLWHHLTSIDPPCKSCDHRYSDHNREEVCRHHDAELEETCRCQQFIAEEYDDVEDRHQTALKEQAGEIRRTAMSNRKWTVEKARAFVDSQSGATFAIGPYPSLARWALDEIERLSHQESCTGEGRECDGRCRQDEPDPDQWCHAALVREVLRQAEEIRRLREVIGDVMRHCNEAGECPLCGAWSESLCARLERTLAEGGEETKC